MLGQRGKMAASTVLTTCFTLMVGFWVVGVHCAKNTANLVDSISDVKDFKKLLRTKTNVLVLFTKSGKDASDVMKIYAEVAEAIRGQGTLAYVDCNGEGKKMCKKLKVSPSTYTIKHYKDGEFNKDYDRKESLQSMVNFMKDPTGDVPWEEDSSLADVVHVPDGPALGKLLRRETKPLMMMFYAPWCGFCKRLKPQYAEAATELRGHSIFAAMDVNKPENSIIRQHFNITGFPTMMYFESGNLKFKYEGENTKDGLVKFMRNPEKPPEKPKEEEWSETESEVVHLTDATFDHVISQEPSVLVMFYAPWCGHCKAMKPEYVDAAAKLKAKNVEGALAAVDATKESVLGTRFAVKGYPTVKYFRNGQFEFDVNFRTADKIIEFMKDPKEPPPPPPPEKPWSDTESQVVHLTEETFKTFLKKKKHALVMFYAPWCGHCKKAKPEFIAAAEQYKDDTRVAFAAVDCTSNQQTCAVNEVQGYPTIKYFSYHKIIKPYEGGRTEADFVAFMKDPQNPQAGMPAPKSPQQHWADVHGSQFLHHLEEANFDDFVAKQESALVMFYAPWCDHCAKLKPIFAEAATRLKSDDINGVLATVDGSVERGLKRRFEIKGYPTLKYFRFGEFVADYSKDRIVDSLVAFMKNPPDGDTARDKTSGDSAAKEAVKEEL